MEINLHVRNYGNVIIVIIITIIKNFFSPPPLGGIANSKIAKNKIN